MRTLILSFTHALDLDLRSLTVGIREFLDNCELFSVQFKNPG